jgi:sialic acid synthase SpsE
MKNLSIKDLARTEELSRGDMSAVRGGHGLSAPSYSYVYSPKSDSSINAKQDLQQFQSVVNATANGSAFVDGVFVTNNTSQFGQNNLLVV